MKAIFISFNQAYYESIVNLMDRINLRGFTYWNEVQGRGSHTGETTLWQPCLADLERCHPNDGARREGGTLSLAAASDG